MKKITLLFAFTLLLANYVFAQSPNLMSYQAVIRNASNTLVSNSLVSTKISIIQGTTNGTLVYSEIQNASTNANGLMSIQIGGGSSIFGNFSTIDWSNGPYFIKTETDPNGGANYTIVGVTQFLSVPYAFYARTSGSSIPGPQGPAGPQGANGVSITSTQVINDSLFITLSNNQVINAGYVKGPQGVQGIQGNTGPQGPIGQTGAQGPIGLTGATGPTGPQGAIGPIGPQGNTGPQGPIGLTGATGPQGPAGVDGISITNTIVQNDSLFIVLSNNQILNAGYVKGPQGLQGIQGPAGPQGTTGAVGPQGPIGLTGATGPQGAQGPAGLQGATGAVGPQGPIGLTGATGSQGAQGPAGPQGATGAVGPQGPAGSNGISVQSTQVQNDSLYITLSNNQVINAGYVKGPQGVQGNTGPQGPIGQTGPQGPIGLTGATGPIGPQGVAGPIGPQGPIGLTGASGPVGPQGPAGPQGATGAVGPQGPIGLTGATGLQGPTGPAGANGISVQSTQVQNDSLYITLSNNQVINAGYVKGPQGIQGLQGIAGPQGPIGLTGAAGSQGPIGPAGANGVSVQSTQVQNDSLYITLSNNQVLNAGYVKGPQGIQGLQGIAGPQGPIGLTGAAGSQGAQGPAGPQGATGAQGPAGANGISVQSTQIQNDSLYFTLNNSQVLNAGYVKGPQGIQGLQGIAGPQGPIGLTGAPGPQGAQGPIGLTGAAGPIGPQGSAGPQGATGAVGPQGPAGSNGISVQSTQVQNDSLYITLSNNQVINAGYVKGPQGIQGLQGNVGSQGLSGANGKNTLVKTSTENAGLNCASGGIKIEYGLDTNNNGMLDTLEVDTLLTQYICNAASNQGVKIGFSSSSTWTCPQGVTQITVELWGGAGSGSGCLVWYANQYLTYQVQGAKGGNGGYLRQTLNVVPGFQYSITIGTGGLTSGNPQISLNINNNQPVCAADGVAGGASSFDGILTANGGGGASAPCGYPYSAYNGSTIVTTSPSVNGNDGAVINYPSQYPTRSYLPSFYLNQRPIESAQGGNGYFLGATQSLNGEDGFCVISY